MYTTNRAKHTADYDIPERRAPSRASSQTKISLMEQRSNNRAVSLKKRTTEAERLKEEGNCHFKAGRHVEAIAKYCEAAKVAGLRPVIMSNLAAAYLKLEQYELAEWACDCALLYSPNIAKARFRRALARKGQGMNKGAELDLLVVTKHHPDIKEAQEELARVCFERKISGDGKRAEPKYDEEFPLFDGEEWDPPLDSDSEDSRHVGNKRPCKFYNRGGCGKGLGCGFSHAPDDNSVRDDLGHNVCSKFLLDRCKQGPRCSYAHTMSYLGQGWWSSTTEVNAATKLLDILADPSTDSHTIATLENTSLYGRLKKARDYRSDLDSYSILTPDVLRSRIKDKTQSTPGNSSKLSPQDGSLVILLCLQEEALFNNINGHLLKSLKTKAKLVHARNVAQVSTYLEAPELAGVIVTDSEIVDRKNSSIVHKLVDYVKDGGSVVFGYWKYGSYFRTDFFKNPGNDIVKINPSLDNSYNMKALHIQRITPSSVLYKANETSFTQSLVFYPDPVTDFSESPAVTAHVGSGRVSFLGDVNAEESSTSTILAMLGLLDAPLPPAPSVLLKQKPEEAQASGTKKATSNKGKKKKTPNSSASSQPSTLPSNPGSSITSLPPQPSVTSLPSASAFASPPTPSLNGSGIFRNSRMSKSSHDGHFIMQLTLEYGDIVDQMCKSQLDAIRAKMDVRKVTSDAQAIELLASPHLCGIFATDPGLTDPRHSQLLVRLVDYVSRGGYLVFGGTFACFVRYPKVAPFFSVFNLTWKAGAYTRESLERNLDNELVETNTFLPDKIGIQALFLCDAEVEEMLYTPTSHGVNITAQSPIVCSGVGSGRVGFIGDVNADTCSTPSLLSMFNLLQPSRAAPKPLPHQFIIILTHRDTIDEYEETPLFAKLKEKRVEIVTDEHLSDPRLADLLASRNLLGVVVLDDVFSAPEREWLEHQIAAYAWSGGTVIFGGDFGVMTHPDDFKMFMMQNFCLPWKISSAIQLAVKLNGDNPFIRSLSHVVPQEHVHLEGAFIYDVSPEAMIYKSQPGLEPERAIHVSVAYAGVGKGHVAYFGHEEIEDLDTTLMLAMMKL